MLISSVSEISNEFLPWSCFPNELSSPGQKKQVEKIFEKSKLF